MSGNEGRTSADLDALAAISVSDLNTNVNHEPRLLDIRVAERLGYERPRKIRDIIERNREELEAHGILTHQQAMTHGGTRPTVGRVYWLNEAHTLLICMLSKTERAALVRKEVIEVFMAWRRGEEPRRRSSVDQRAIRQLLALWDRLDNETRPLLRHSIHHLIVQAMADMGHEAPPLEAFEPPEPDLLIPFWRGVTDLEANGIRINHAHNPNLIALRLRDVRDEFAKSQIYLPHSQTLRETLKQSRSPRFVAVKTVNSAIERRAVKCWVFEGWKPAASKD